ncbi:MAG: NAD(P)/FAD-dependent oxidoreductase [Saprospiraceae bacterium]
MLKYHLSYWEQETFFKDVDLVVIGAGIVGLNAAIHARVLAPRARVLVVERGPLPVGASTRNAGFACWGSLTELLDDMQRYGENSVFDLIAMRWDGLQRLRQRCGDEALRYEPLGGFEMFTDDDLDDYHNCVEAAPYFNDKLRVLTGQKDTYISADERIPAFGFAQVRHLICNTGEGQLHTGAMMQRLLGLAREAGVEVLCGMPIAKIEQHSNGVELHTEYGWSIRAAKTLVAVNGFAADLLDSPAVAPARNQVLITDPIPGLRIKGSFHYDRGYYYFRNIDGRILLGGGRNLDPEAERTAVFGANELIRSALVHLLNSVICPDRSASVAQWWSGILGLGPEKKPVVQKIGPHLAVAVRLSGMGVAIGTLVGENGVALLFEEAVAPLANP